MSHLPVLVLVFVLLQLFLTTTLDRGTHNQELSLSLTFLTCCQVSCSFPDRLRSRWSPVVTLDSRRPAVDPTSRSTNDPTDMLRCCSPHPHCMHRIATATARHRPIYREPSGLGSRVVSELDSGAEWSGFKSQSCLRQTVHTHRASVHQAAKLVAALLRVAGVTTGLAESNGSVPPGL